MKKLFRVLLALHIALYQFIPDLAQAAQRFLTCNTTCTITAVDTSIWGTTTGGTGASVPGSSDDVVLDGATCVGGTTCTATFGAGYNPTWQALTMSACTASTSGCILDANPNTNTITLTNSGAYTNTGAGTRTLSGGTWVLSNNAALWTINASATVTNNPSVSYTGTGNRRFFGGGKTYGTVSNVSGTSFIINGNNTIGTFTPSPGNSIYLNTGVNLTITTITNVTGSSSLQTLFINQDTITATVTITPTNNWTCDWCGFSNITRAGAGTITATNSFDFKGNNTGASFTITAPSVGGGGGRIIGG